MASALPRSLPNLARFASTSAASAQPKVLVIGGGESGGGSRDAHPSLHGAFRRIAALSMGLLRGCFKLAVFSPALLFVWPTSPLRIVLICC